MTDSQRTPARPDKQMQIADDLRIRMERGDLAPGDLLPPISELIHTYNCSTAAARAAVELLKQQGLVSGGRGKPPRVRVQPAVVTRWSGRHQQEKDMVLRPAEERARDGVVENDLGKNMDDVDFSAKYSTTPADNALSKAFGVNLGDNLLERIFEWKDKATGRRLLWSASYIPLSIAEGSDDLINESRAFEAGSTQYQFYAMGIELEEVRDVVSARMPTTVEMELWDLEKGVPLLVVRRTSVDTNGRVVEVSDAEFPADRTELGFRTTLDRWPADVFNKED
ncbi:MAG TPA: GntR family transcriptional regulator [Kribbella sp.]